MDKICCCHNYRHYQGSVTFQLVITMAVLEHVDSFNLKVMDVA